MKLEDYKLFIIAIGVIGILLIASPIIASLIVLPQGEQFTELYILGPQHMAADYPYNVAPNQNYSIYLDVTNHMGTSAFYLVYIKLLNGTDTLPDSQRGAASLIQPAYEYRFAIQDQQTWETSIIFAIANVKTLNNQTIIGDLQINGKNIRIDKPIIWNSTTSTNQFRLMSELWITTTNQATEFDNRYVSLNLNCTSLL